MTKKTFNKLLLLKLIIQTDENSGFFSMESGLDFGLNTFKFNYDKDLHNVGKKDVIRVAKCSTMTEAIKFIASSLVDLNVIGFQIKLEYSNMTSLSDSDILQILEKVQRHRSILILLESFSNGFLICWKLKGRDTFFNTKIEAGHSKLVDFIKDNLIASFKVKHNGEKKDFYVKF